MVKPINTSRMCFYIFYGLRPSWKMLPVSPSSSINLTPFQTPTTLGCGVILPSKCSKDKNILWIWRKTCFGRNGHVNISIFVYLRCRNDDNNNNKKKKQQRQREQQQQQQQQSTTQLDMFRWWLQCLSHFRLFIQQKANNLSQGLKACPHQTDFIAGCIEDELCSLLIDHFTLHLHSNSKWWRWWSWLLWNSWPPGAPQTLCKKIPYNSPRN